MPHRRAPLRPSPRLTDHGMAAIAPPRSPPIGHTVENRVKTTLLALARLLGAQAARESIKAQAAVPPTESSGGVDE